jgi:hypothetical protein
MRRKDGAAHALMTDIDNDGESELVIRNNHLFAVFAPRWGGRLVALYSVSGDRGTMVAGNPCDDWNWMEELNRYMDVPRNHPGAFADSGFEHDGYDVEIVDADGIRACIRMTNVEDSSKGRGLIKEVVLGDTAAHLTVRYSLPPGLASLEFEAALSPDYLTLLRQGDGAVQPCERDGMRGCRTGSVFVWLRLGPGTTFETPHEPRCGHGCMFRVRSAVREFQADIGVSLEPPDTGSQESDAAQPDVLELV